ncbi:MAG: GntR family transcriptional regulator [Phycisphaerae bacterium]|nr:GntR family transcriptional regulator [Phycisphaerae bacterium]
MDTPEPIQPATPLTLDLRNRIRRLILTKCQPGQRLPTEAELARQMLCSVGSVRKALAALAGEELVVRRQGSGTYASEHIPQKKGTTGLLYYGTPGAFTADNYIRQSYHGLLSSADQCDRHLHVILAHSRKPFGLERDIRRRLDLSMLDSLVYLEIFEHNLMAELARWLPTISVDFACCQPGVSSCALDHDQNMAEAVEHLRRLGHRRIGLVGIINQRHADPAVIGRIRAFDKAVRQQGLIAAPDWIASAWQSEEVVDVMRRWLQAKPTDRPTALLCYDQLWRFAHAAILMGVSIPSQLSLMSYDRVPCWLAWIEQEVGTTIGSVLDGQPTNPLDPRLAALRNMQATALDLPFAAMGEWAIAEVQRRVGSPGVEPRHELFAASVLPGNTVAPPGT